MPGRVEGQATRVHGKSQDICFAYTPGAIREDGRQILSKLVLEKTRGWQEGVCLCGGRGEGGEERGAGREEEEEEEANSPPTSTHTTPKGMTAEEIIERQHSISTEWHFNFSSACFKD